MSNDVPEAIPQPTRAEHTIDVARAFISEFPGGSTVLEIFNAWIQPPFARRQQAWLESLAMRLLRLEQLQAGFTAQTAFEDPVFFSRFVQATRVAMGTHHAEKLAALRNALLNTALGTAPEEDIQALFLTFVEALTPSHLQALAYFTTPREHRVPIVQLRRNRDAAPPAPYIPELSSHPEFANQVAQDLQARGLLQMTHVGVPTGEANMVYATALTPFGQQFLDFITSPLAEDRVSPS